MVKEPDLNVGRDAGDTIHQLFYEALRFEAMYLTADGFIRLDERGKDRQIQERTAKAAAGDKISQDIISTFTRLRMTENL